MKTLVLFFLGVLVAQPALAQEESPTQETRIDVSGWRRATDIPTETTPLGAQTSATDGTVADPIAPEDQRPGPECRRQIGGAVGMVVPNDGWDLLGSGPRFTGSPALSMVCTLGGKIRPFGALTTAPTQRHWYRELGQAGLYIMPSFGLVTGRKSMRYGIYTVMMPRLIGIGASIEFRFKDADTGWLTNNSQGRGKGFELRAQVLDGDLVQYQLQLLYTFGVSGS
jgi:hypothetical protein